MLGSLGFGTLWRRVLAEALLVLLAAAFMPLATAGGSPRASVGEFSAGEIGPWQEKIFRGRTDYRLHAEQGRSVLAARTRGSASGLFREIAVDLTRTPYLNWSWRVENVYTGIDEASKAGDDYPARVYVVVSGGLRFWKTRALSYVWASRLPEGSHWPNAFTGNARMVAVESGERHIGKWRHYKRDVRADLAQAFGEDIRELQGVALMSDSDNARRSATAYYGDLYFSAE